MSVSTMFWKVFLLANVFATVLCAPKSGTPRLEPALPCNAQQCVLPDCRCFSSSIPGGLPPSEIPQLVLLTFDDGVTALNFEYYDQAFTGRTNPDGCPVQATFYISHEYTDYSKVHALHALGHEIATHSITHNINLTYWDNLSVEGHIDEFGGHKQILSQFGNIPSEDIRGLRVPSLQLGGNNSFEAIKELGMLYDASWPTQNYMNAGIWPYTLDFASTQDCPIGTCPHASIPGVWVAPMINWNDDSGFICSMVDACIFVPQDTDGLFDFMVRNFQRHYNGNRAPFGFYVHAAWFAVQARFDAYIRFLDYLGTLNDVYLVSTARTIEWAQRPTPASELQSLWPECPTTYAPQCIGTTCALERVDTGETRWMTQCVPTCPAVYPWLGNPLGLA